MVIKTLPINFSLKNGMNGSWRREGREMHIWLESVVNNPPSPHDALPAGFEIEDKGLTPIHKTNPNGTYYWIPIKGWTDDSPLDSSACPTTRNPIAGNGSAISSRQEANKAILNLISKMVIKYPEHRFGQILMNMDVVQREFGTDWLRFWKDEYNLESTDLLDRVLQIYKKLDI
jgi:hypothetical protein